MTDERSPARRVGDALSRMGMNEDEAKRFIRALKDEGIDLVVDAEGVRFSMMKAIVLAIYDGVPGGFSDDDARNLINLAAWLDIIDDAADVALTAAGKRLAERTIQENLRRIAERLRTVDAGSLGLV